MANGGPSVTEAPEQGGAPTPAPAPGGGGPPGSPPGGGPPPLLAALAQQRGQPQVSTPGMGDNASSLSLVMTALANLSQALPGLMGTPLHGEVAGMISRLSKRVNRNAAPTVGVQKTQLDTQRQALGRNALLATLMGQGGGQQGGPPQEGQGVPPGAAQSPMPSTPFPGA